MRWVIKNMFFQNFKHFCKNKDASGYKKDVFQNLKHFNKNKDALGYKKHVFLEF